MGDIVKRVSRRARDIAYRYSRSVKIGASIKAARVASGWSQAKLARKINSSQPALSDWERGRSEPSRDKVKAIEKALGLPEGALESVSKEDGATPVPALDPQMAYAILVPEFDIRAAAGAGAANDHETEKRRWPFTRETLTELRLRHTDLAIIEISGDSMSPTLSSGDRIMIDRSDKRPPGIFVIWDGDGLIAKRIERVPGPKHAPQRLRITSDNKLHNDHEVEAEWVQIIGRVVGLIRRL